MGVSAGLKIADSCVEQYGQQKDKHAYDFVTYVIKDDAVVVEHAEQASLKDCDPAAFEEGGFAKFYDILTNCAEPRYATVNFHVETADGRNVEKLVFFWWSPDRTAKVRDKMIYSSTCKTFKEKLGLSGLK